MCRTLITEYEKEINSMSDDGGHDLIVDGNSLNIILAFASNEFRDLAAKCQSVLGCRLSPMQKCQVNKINVG